MVFASLQLPFFQGLVTNWWKVLLSVVPRKGSPSLCPSHPISFISGAPRVALHHKILPVVLFPPVPNPGVLPGCCQNSLLCSSGCLSQLSWTSPSHPFSHPSRLYFSPLPALADFPLLLLHLLLREVCRRHLVSPVPCSLAAGIGRP